MVFLITFTTYGTHLPGDARGSFDHVRNGNRRFIGPNPGLEAYCRGQLRRELFFLDTAPSRNVCRDAIVGVCAHRGWRLMAIQVRMTHVHAVVDSGGSPRDVLQAWKSYSTRALRQAGLIGDRPVWTHGGNAALLRSRESIDAAVRYVIEGQGTPMAVYVEDDSPPA